jgi:hypothetical protein
MQNEIANIDRRLAEAAELLELQHEAIGRMDRDGHAIGAPMRMLWAMMGQVRVMEKQRRWTLGVA